MNGLSERSKEICAKTVGIDFDTLLDMDWDDIDAHIAKKVGLKKLPFMVVGDPRLFMRGTPYFETNRFVDMDDIDAELANF